MALQDLYQEMIIDHGRSPRNRGAVDGASHRADGHNPLCGDEIHLTLLVADGKIEAIRFEGQACAICTATASMMTEMVVGLPVAEALAIMERFHARMVTGADTGDLGPMEALVSVREYPMRVKCTTLPWHTLKAALQQQTEATTE